MVFEALANGAVPGGGGPWRTGDIVREDVGYRIRLSNERRWPKISGPCSNIWHADRDHLEALRRRGQTSARKELTWERKAQMITDILNFVKGARQGQLLNHHKYL